MLVHKVQGEGFPDLEALTLQLLWCLLRDLTTVDHLVI